MATDIVEFSSPGLMPEGRLTERKMGQAVSFTPAEQADMARQEANPEWDAELNREDVLHGNEIIESGPNKGRKKSEIFDEERRNREIARDIVTFSQKPATDTVEFSTQGEAPSLRESFAQGVASGFGATAKAATLAAGGLASLVSQDAGDAVFDYANRIGKSADELVLTPEQQAAGTFGNKVASAVGGVVPALMSGPIGAVAQMTGQGALNAGTEALDEGASLGQAAGISAVQGALGAAQGALPVLGRTPWRAGGIGAGTNVLGGTMSDAFINKVILNDDQTELKQRYNPADYEKRGIEAITGFAFGYGGKKLERFARNVQGEKMLEGVKSITGDLDATLSDQIGLTKPGVMQAGETHAAAKERLIRDGGSAQDLLSVMADDPNETPVYKELARALHSMGRAVGAEEVTLSPKLLEEFAGPGTIGQYDNLADMARFDTKRITPEIVLHEIVHSYTVGAIKFYADNPTLPKDASKVQRRIWEKVSAVEDIRKMAERELDAALRDSTHTGETITRLRKNEWQDFENGQPVTRKGYRGIEDFYKRQEMIRNGHPVGGVGDHEMTRNEFYRMAYGMDNRLERSPDGRINALAEFVTTVMTNPQFQMLLSELKVPADIAVKIKPRGIKRMANLWTAFKQSIKDMLLASNHGFKNTMLEASMDRVLDLNQAMTPSMRMSAMSRAELRAKPHLAEKAFDEYQAKERSKKNSQDSNYLIGRMNFLREQAMSKAEFINRLRDEIPKNEDWNNLVSKWGDTLWENPHKLNDIWQRSKAEGSTLEKWTKSDPNIDRFMREWADKYGIKAVSKEDGKVIGTLHKRNDLNASGRDVMTSNALRLLKSGTVAGDILKWVHDRVADYRQIKQISFERGKEYFSEYTKLSKKDQLDLLDLIAYYQDWKGREMIKKQGRKVDPNGEGQWLTDSMLKAEGMNEAQIKAYNKLTDGLDYYWSLINQARVKMGRPPLQQIPGYMPHVWEGAYKVFVTFTENPKYQGDMPPTKTVELRAFNTRRQAEIFAASVKNKKAPNGTFDVLADEVSGLPYKVGKFEDLSATISGTMAEHLEAYQNQLLLDPATLQTIERIENDAMRGFSKHFLEQEGIKGWRGSEGTQNMTTREQNKYRHIWQDYAKNISEMYGNTLFMDEVIQPMLTHFSGDTGTRNTYGILWQKMPELQNAIRDFALNFTGENLNKLKWADKFLQDASIKLGIDPLAYRKAVRTMKNYMSATMLHGNPKNWLANYAQPYTVASNLQLFNSQLALETGRKDLPNVLKSFQEGMSLHDRPDKITQNALDWARSRHIVDPLLSAEMKVGEGMVGKVLEKTGLPNERLESLGREKAFVIAYTHMRKVYQNDAKAREAAANVMEMTMVNYDRSERPLMYQNYGIGSEMISPFAVFRNAYLSNMYMVLKHMVQNPTSIHGYAPFLLQQATFIGMAGLSGAFLASEYDAFAKIVNDNTSLHLPTIGQLLVEAKANDWATYGIPGTLVGANVGSSMNAPGFDDAVSLALPEFLKNLLLMGTALAKDAASFVGVGKGATSEDYMKPGRALAPPVLRAPIEAYEMGTVRLKPKAGSQEGMVERTPAEFAKETVWGAPDLRVAREGTAAVLDLETEKAMKEQAKSLVKTAVDISNGKQSSITFEEAYTKWYAITGGNLTEFNKAIKDAMEGKYTTYYDRLLKQKKTPRNVDRMEDFGARSNVK